MDLSRRWFHSNSWLPTQQLHYHTCPDTFSCLQHMQVNYLVNHQLLFTLLTLLLSHLSYACSWQQRKHSMEAQVLFLECSPKHYCYQLWSPTWLPCSKIGWDIPFLIFFEEGSHLDLERSTFSTFQRWLLQLLSRFGLFLHLGFDTMLHFQIFLCYTNYLARYFNN